MILSARRAPTHRMHSMRLFGPEISRDRTISCPPDAVIWMFATFARTSSRRRARAVRQLESKRDVSTEESNAPTTDARPFSRDACAKSRISRPGVPSRRSKIAGSRDAPRLFSTAHRSILEHASRKFLYFKQRIDNGNRPESIVGEARPVSRLGADSPWNFQSLSMPIFLV